jgi:hypothetical protein
MLPLRIGGGSEFIELRLPRRGASNGWFHAEVEIAVQCFSGSVTAFFDAADFQNFEKGLRPLYTTLRGTAELKPMEGQVVISLKGNGRGGIAVEGEAWSQANWQNKLQFTFEIDQTFLPQTLAQLETINAECSNAGA